MLFWFHTLGCRVNQAETQSLREGLLSSGHAPAASPAEADVCLVNTCAVTRQAERDALRLLRRLRRENPLAQLVVTGCYATRDPGEIRRLFPDARIVSNQGKAALPALFGCPPVSAEFKVGEFHGHARAFIKIQDGCNMRCAYCVIPDLRARLSSKPFPLLREEVRGLVEKGYREIVLCGIRLGRYLSDEGGESIRRVDLPGALERLLELPGDFRLRLSSLEITDLTDRLLEVLKRSGGRLCPSFHLPLQSGSERVLKRMERWYTPAFYARRVEALRKAAPEAGLFTDLMVGFPGETEADFRASRSFVEEHAFSGLHVFRFSPRPGTPAASLKPLAEPVLLERSRAMHGVDRDLRLAFARANAGAKRRVLVEGGEAVAENFLRVRLEPSLPPSAGGLEWVRVGEGGDVPPARLQDRAPDDRLASIGADGL